MAANKIKKAQTGSKETPKRKPITEKDMVEKFIPEFHSFMKNTRPTAPSDSVLNRRIKEGIVKRDERSGDVFPTKKFYTPGRSLYKKGGVVKKKATKRKK